MEVSILEFLRSGIFGSFRLGMALGQILDITGPPALSEQPSRNKRREHLAYGRIELFFYDNVLVGISVYVQYGSGARPCSGITTVPALDDLPKMEAEFIRWLRDNQIAVNRDELLTFDNQSTLVSSGGVTIVFDVDDGLEKMSCSR